MDTCQIVSDDYFPTNIPGIYLHLDWTIDSLQPERLAILISLVRIKTLTKKHTSKGGSRGAEQALKGLRLGGLNRAYAVCWVTPNFWKNALTDKKKTY